MRRLLLVALMLALPVHAWAAAPTIDSVIPLSPTVLQVFYDQALDVSTANDESNYTCTGGVTVSAAKVESQTSVILSLSAGLATDDKYTVESIGVENGSSESTTTNFEFVLRAANVLAPVYVGGFQIFGDYTFRATGWTVGGLTTNVVYHRTQVSTGHHLYLWDGDSYLDNEISLPSDGDLTVADLGATLEYYSEGDFPDNQWYVIRYDPLSVMADTGDTLTTTLGPFTFEKGTAGIAGPVLGPSSDTDPPTISAAAQIGPVAFTATFSEALDETIAETTGNYSLSPSLTINAAVLGGVGSNIVTITTSADLSPGVTYTVTCNNIEDLAGNEITANSTEQFTADSGTMLLHSDMDSAADIHQPAVSQAEYGTQAEAVPGLSNITFVTGQDGNAAQVESPNDWNGDIWFDGDNFDFADTDNDGGRVDLVMRFDTDPKATANNWLLVEDQTGSRSVNFEMSGSPSQLGFFSFSSTPNSERRPYPAQGWGMRADASGDYWDEVDIDEWHTYSFLWRNNGSTDKDEVHIFVDGVLQGSSYNGNLPDAVADADELDDITLAGSTTGDFTFDDIYSFGSWDISSAPSVNYATVAWPDSVFNKFPLFDGFAGDTDLKVTTSNQVTYEFMVNNEVTTPCDCELFVDNASVTTIEDIENLEHVEYYDSQVLSNGNHTWRVECESDRIESPTWTFEVDVDASGPSISSLSDPTPSDGQSITISGSGFGANALDLDASMLGDGNWIESGSAGTDLVDANLPTNWSASNYGSTPAEISTDRARSGSKSVDASVDYSATTYWQRPFYYVNSGGFTEVYASFWVYWDPTLPTPGADLQWKIWRVSTNSGSGSVVSNHDGSMYMNAWMTNSGWNIYNYTSDCSLDCAENSSYCLANLVTIPVSDDSPDRSTSLAPDIGGWTRLEVHAVASAVDTADGSIRYTTQREGETSSYVMNWPDGLITRRSGACAPDGDGTWHAFVLQGFWEHGSNANDVADIYYDDIFVQFGTPARVVLANSATYSSATNIEIQEPTTWSPTGITINYNLGSFAPTDDVWLYVIHDDETVSAAFPVDGAAASTPAAPSSLTATADGQNEIDLAWTDNADNETGFSVERSSTSGVAGFSEIATPAANSESYSATGLSAGTQYWFRVRAENGEGFSGYSNVDNATTLDVVPADPTTLDASAASSSQINLTWVDNADNETGYSVEMSSTSAVAGFSEIATPAADAEAYNATGLSAATTYWFRVRAENAIGFSGYSGVVEQATQTAVPAQPTSLNATPVSVTQINLTWTDNATNETEYLVYMSTGGEFGSYALTATLAADTEAYSATGLASGTEHWFRILAKAGALYSAPSDAEQATTEENPVPPPTAAPPAWQCN